MENELPRIRKESGVFWIEVEKIKPNPMQPRREFDEEKLKELSESIRQYGVLQPLVVIRKEKEFENGTVVEYELIAGERRWRASQLAGLNQVPVVIREESSEKVKLELALIENLQREDLSPLERAEAFRQLVDDFKMRHHEVGAKIGKSREFVSNTIRLLSLSDEMQEGLRQRLITEGHTRPLLSLIRQPEDQLTLYKEIIYRKMTVREAENISRRLVKEFTVRKIRVEKEDPETKYLEEQISNALGTRVLVEQKGTVKRISIDFFSEEELGNFLAKLGAVREKIQPSEPAESDSIENEQEIMPEAEVTEEDLRENFTI